MHPGDGIIGGCNRRYRKGIWIDNDVGDGIGVYPIGISHRKWWHPGKGNFNEGCIIFTYGIHT